jgi:hypothetical protein
MAPHDAVFPANRRPQDEQHSYSAAIRSEAELTFPKLMLR